MKNFVLKKIPIILVLSFVFTSIFSLFSFTASAHSYTSTSSNSSSTVIVRPVSGSMSVGSIGVESVKVFWQENGYYYIEYTVSGYGGFKRGYVPTSKINVSGIGNNPYPAWNSNTSQNYTVYNRTTTVSYTIGTVYSTDSITVYAEEGDWYYIQYPVSGGYKRGYVPKSIVYKTPQTSGITNGAIYYIRNVNSGKYLDVQGAGTSSGTNVWQYDFNGSVAQQWQVEYLSNEGLYKLHPQNATTMNLDVSGSSMNNGDNIVIYGGDYSSSRWNIVNLGDGTFKLMSNCSERTKAMVVQNASMDSGANVFQWDFNNGSNDKWVFEPIFVSGTDYILAPANDSNPGFASKSASIQVASELDSYATNAINGWNLKAGTSMTKSSSSSSYITIDIDWIWIPSDVMASYETTQKSNGRATAFAIKLYDNHINSYHSSYSLTDNQKNISWANIIAHELGHSLGLNDNPTGAASIMKYSYTTWNGYYPEKADIAGVSMYYN